EPAPNNAVWNVQLFIAGGTPASGAGRLGDVVELETPGGQTVTYTPSPTAYTIPALPVGVSLTAPTPGGIDTAILRDVTNTSTIAITPFTLTIGSPPLPAPPPFVYTSSPGGAEQVVYQGLGGPDNLTVTTPTSGGHTFNYNPGATTDSATVQMDATLPLSFQG